MPRLLPALVPLLVVVLMGCAPNGSGSSDLDLSPAAARGEKLARTNGCTACHGAQGEGLVGAPFVGLFGSEVTFDDGSTTTADEAYLIESIKDPNAKKVAGYQLSMPTNGLSDDDIDSIVTYIEELGDTAGTTP
jgi:cytochrome c oxidase subunit 2